MLYLKACKKCHGDMYLDTDVHGAYLQCLQCGAVRDLDRAPVVSADRAHARKVLAMPRSGVLTGKQAA